jgi:deoxyhypusine monooxygenase
MYFFSFFSLFLGSAAAVRALCAGLSDANSPLFRHECAYVLGQLAHPISTPSLMKTILDVNEHEMVRHEAAESLGAIGTPDATEFLEKYINSGTIMLKESCEVALDCTDYWSTMDASKEGVNVDSTISVQ